ncbi:hypothetical protein FPHYL_2956 [Fusarium phyllophilum]|uniref:ASST-domain-containing protein n=1 Tax=Fusarium phyllophilum TaxID=47803 RepID=A0A8H5K7P0_9HYPO|nr:hypothetical protein FPHYL_2956 [Fusarium phyllophilum]
MTGFSISSSLALVVALLGIATADRQYRSRPDLAPPQLNITIPATEHVSPGYIFVGPYPGFDGVRAGPEQTAAYIFTNTGDLVWSSLGHFAGWVGNFQAVRYRGKPALQAFQGYLDPFHGHGYGTPILLDDHYQPLALVQTPNHRLISIHEFKIVNEKTALVEIYQPTAMDLGPFGGSVEEQWIVDGVFQEFDIASGELLFEGHTLDWASPADSIIPLRSGRAFTGANASDAWDYFHINSVDKNDQGDYLISGRHMSALYKINGSDGSLLWQLGGRKSTISHPDFDFGYQHDARFLNRSEDGSVETISFFDNSARSDRQRTGGVDRLHPHSRARIVEINHDHNTARELNTFTPPDYLSAPSQSNVQVLENQNVFVNWGQEGAVTEFSPDGTPIFHAYLESGDLAPGVQSYRGFRGEWTGYSSETPAVVAYADGSELSLYASWNDDTVTAAWRFYSQCTTERRQRGGGYETRELGNVARKSFETSLVIPINQLHAWSKDCGIFAQAVDVSGNLLSTSKVGNAVWVHSYDRETGKVEEVQYLAADEGPNTRHLTVHPSGKWVYAVYEEANSIAAYKRDTKTGKLDFHNETYGLLPSGFTNSSSYWADEVLLSTPAEGSSPKYLLAATRSRKTGVPGYVSAFSLDAKTGRIEEQLFLQKTTNSGGSANAVSPASFSEVLFAITDSGSNFVEVWKIKGKSASAVAHLDLENGPANAVWYS